MVDSRRSRVIEFSRQVGWRSKPVRKPLPAEGAPFDAPPEGPPETLPEDPSEGTAAGGNYAIWPNLTPEKFEKRAAPKNVPGSATPD